MGGVGGGEEGRVFWGGFDRKFCVDGLGEIRGFEICYWTVTYMVHGCEKNKCVFYIRTALSMASRVTEIETGKACFWRDPLSLVWMGNPGVCDAHLLHRVIRTDRV